MTGFRVQVYALPMIAVITRKLEFDAGHRVMNHESKCATCHGHRYVLEVTAEDIRRVARQYLVPDNRTVGILSPLKTDKPKMEHYSPGGQVG